MDETPDSPYTLQYLPVRLEAVGFGWLEVQICTCRNALQLTTKFPQSTYVASRSLGVHQSLTPASTVLPSCTQVARSDFLTHHLNLRGCHFGAKHFSHSSKGPKSIEVAVRGVGVSLRRQHLKVTKQTQPDKPTYCATRMHKQN